MKKLALLVVLAVATVICSGRSFSQDVLGIACVGIPGGTTCSDGNTPSLRGYNTATTASYATVAGHNAVSDGGGGSFFKLGAASAKCNTIGDGGQGTVGKSTIIGLSHSKLLTLSVGELVTGSGTDGSGNTVQVQAGTEIASIDLSGNKVTLTLPLAGTSTATNVSMSVTFTGDNDGTLIVDSEMTPQCWQ